MVIDFNDEEFRNAAFKAFYKYFQTYQNALKEGLVDWPELWLKFEEHYNDIADKAWRYEELSK